MKGKTRSWVEAAAGVGSKGAAKTGEEKGRREKLLEASGDRPKQAKRLLRPV
jgi:hypothetical protein